MDADLLIKKVLAEGVKHVVVPDYDPVMPRRDDPKVVKRAVKFASMEKGSTLDRIDYAYGPGLSRNHHLNAVVRHVLPSLGSMVAGSESMSGPSKQHGYSKMKSIVSGLSGQEREIWNEYDRHLSDLAFHIHKTITKRTGKMRVVGGKLPRNVNALTRASLRHDVVDHRGLGNDISLLGEIISTFHNPHLNPGKDGLHPDDHHLENGSIDNLKAHLDKFYRGKEYFDTSTKAQPPKLKKEDYNRILKASKKISIQLGWKRKSEQRREAGNQPKIKSEGPQMRGGDVLGLPPDSRRSEEGGTGGFKARHYDRRSHLRKLKRGRLP